MIAIDSVNGTAAEAAASNSGLFGIAIPSTLPDHTGFSGDGKIDYALRNMEPKPIAKTRPTRRRSPLVLLLILPYLGLCFPRLYAKSIPEFWGFPYFYWYQFAWVIITSALLGLVYLKLKT
jgi:hypothetical protein